MSIFHLPDLGEGLAEAEIREWYVKEGDEVKVDQPLVSMETAKAVVDVPSPQAGKIIKLHGDVNQVVETGAPLITFEGAEKVKAEEGDKGSVVGALESSSEKLDESKVIVGGGRRESSAIRAMPAARLLANEMGVDLSALTGTGPKGLITITDVKAKLGAKKSAVSRPDIGATESLRGVRRMMAQAMQQSHQEIVPVTIVEDVDIGHLQKGTDITVMLFEAIVAAVKAEPAMNAWYDSQTIGVRKFEEVNIGMAVDTSEGLFVPVIKDAASLSKEKMRAKIDEYKVTVKDRTIDPSDMQGATITLSNFGTIAGKYATPIIVPPAVAILGSGRGREVPVVRDGKVVPGKVMPLSLTFDHRAATGGEATRFLGAVIDYIKKQ